MPLTRTATSSLALRVPEVDEVVAFYTRIVGLRVHSALDGGGVRLGWGAGHHVLDLRPGERALELVAFEVAAPGLLDELAGTLGATLDVVDGIRGFEIRDPDGNRLRFHDIVDRAGEQLGDGARRPIRYQHATLATSDLATMLAFYTDRVGFRLSDVMGEEFGWLRSSADHHTLAVVESGGRGLDHFSFDVSGWGDLLTWCDRLSAQGVDVTWVPVATGPATTSSSCSTTPRATTSSCRRSWSSSTTSRRTIRSATGGRCRAASTCGAASSPPSGRRAKGPDMATRTTHDHGDVLLVGSIARLDDDWTVEDVFRRSAAALGDHVTMLPDGELGDRSQWITFIARHTYYGHPDLETRSRHTYDDWLPKGYDDQWRFAVREGVDEIRFERIGYAAEAERSYEIFKRLRDEGAIPDGMRFLVAYPLTESAVRAFVNEPRDYEIIWRAYNDAVRRELEYLGTVIAPEDLAIQWDLARETAMIEKVGFNFDDAELTSLPTDPMERYLQALSELSPSVPEGAWLGLHVCYGSLQHEEGESPDSAHYTPIRDLGTAVEMLNRGVVACRRRVDFVHMPVQLADQRDGHYAPLDGLDVGDARVYLGSST